MMITISDRDLRHRLYEEMWKKRPDLFASEYGIKYILDWVAIERYERETGEVIGVLYQMNDYEMFVVDLVEKGRKLMPHGRIILPHNGVIIIPKVGDRFILEDQYRYPTCRKHLAFPRGHCELGATPEEDAAREITEELGEAITGLRYIGKTYPETHSDAWYCSVFAGEIIEMQIGEDGVVRRDGYEGIQNLVAYTAEEIDELIRTQKIDCGYTLAAWALYRANAK